jgi:CelD/BcsL family acetyltransferase involved in cellulose biosynthesis
MSLALRARLWTEDEFAASRGAWQALLSTSTADPLFMSWDWQWRWWVHHHRLLAGKLRVVALYRADGPLVALAPFYLQDVTHRRVLKARRLQLLGGAWRDARPAFSEYLDVICDTQAVDLALPCLAEWLKGQGDWDELVLPYVEARSLAARLTHEFLQGVGLVRIEDPIAAHHIRLPVRFADYVSTLSSNTRRRLVNQRARVEGLELVSTREQDVAADLQVLRGFKLARWGGAPHHPAFLDFHLDFAGAMAQTGRLRLSRLVWRGRPVSVLYDVRVGGTEYYLESGFDPQALPGATPGYLHFGFAIESACQDGLERFDMLAGTGRHRDYKRELCTAETGLVSYQLLRSPLLRTLYSLHALAGRLRHWGSKSRGTEAQFCRPYRSASLEFVAQCAAPVAPNAG